MQIEIDTLGYNVTANYYNETTENETSAYYADTGDWGPKRDPLFIVIPFTILFATIFLTGLIGNVSTCIVIARNRSMHTATNYYLFNLAISDILLLVSGLPQEMYGIWVKYPYGFGETICIVQGFAAETSANATVLTITAFTIERYMAICHPFFSHTLSKLSRVVRLIIAIWTFGICLAVPQAMSFGIVYDLSTKADHYTCNVKRTVIPHAFLISTMLFFVAPMSLITVLYILIGFRLRQSHIKHLYGGSVRIDLEDCKKPTFVHLKNGKIRENVLLARNIEQASAHYTLNEEECRVNYSNQSQHVVKMLVAVVVAFFICWAPFHAQRLLVIYGQPHSKIMVITLSALTYISGVLYYLSTTINPVLYHIMSHKFRTAFQETYQLLLKRNSKKSTKKHIYRCSAAISSHSIRSSLSSTPRNLYESFNTSRRSRCKMPTEMVANNSAYENGNVNSLGDLNIIEIFQGGLCDVKYAREITVVVTSGLSRDNSYSGKTQSKNSIIGIPKSATFPKITSYYSEIQYQLNSR